MEKRAWEVFGGVCLFENVAARRERLVTEDGEVLWPIPEDSNDPDITAEDGDGRIDHR